MGDYQGAVLLPCGDMSLFSLRHMVIAALSGGYGETLEIRVKSVGGTSAGPPAAVYMDMLRAAKQNSVQLLAAMWNADSTLWALYRTMPDAARSVFLEDVRKEMRKYEGRMAYAHPTPAGIFREGFTGEQQTMMRWLDAAEKDRAEDLRP